MRIFLSGLLLMLIALTQIIHAQEADAGADSWPIIENCMADLRYPLVSQADWDFNGIIVSQMYPDGVRALRGDQKVDYFVALDANDSYPLMGSLSPNGVYFAYTRGFTEMNHEKPDYVYRTQNQLIIIRTDGYTAERYIYPIYGERSNVLATGDELPKPIWLDDEWIYIRQQEERGNYQLYNFKTGQLRQWSGDSRPEIYHISPDATRGIRYGRQQMLVDATTGASIQSIRVNQLAWFSDSSMMLVWGDQPEHGTLQILDRNGNNVITIGSFAGDMLAFSPDDRHFAFWDDEKRLYIGDIGTRTVHNLCFQGTFETFNHLSAPNLAWSPDGRTLAFGYEGYPVLLDVATLQNRILNHTGGLIMNWSANEGAVVTVADVHLPNVSDDAFEKLTAPIIPTATPTSTSTATPTAMPTAIPTSTSTATPTAMPTAIPTAISTTASTAIPSAIPTIAPIVDLSDQPTDVHQWLPPDAVFDESVNMRIVAPELTADDWVFDNDFRMIAGVGGAFPYPEGLREVFHLFAINDEALFISDAIRDTNRYWVEFSAWTFDLTTHELLPFDTECALPEYPNWRANAYLWNVVIADEGAYLCNLFTGERSPALPAHLVYGSEYQGSYTISPDGRYVVVLGVDETRSEPSAEYDYGTGHVYSYDVVRGEWLELGEFGMERVFYFHEWFDSAVTFYTGEMRSSYPSANSVYIMDASEAGSLQFGIASYWTPQFLDNPPRYVVGYEQDGYAEQCGNQVFDVNTRQLTEVDTGGMCRPEYGDPYGVAYYRDVEMGQSFECCESVGVEVGEVPLVRYDARTGERQELYRGEIEQIIWVSPDDRYAILVIDNNGVIDQLPYHDGSRYAEMGFPSMNLINLETGQRLGIAFLSEEFNVYNHGYYNGLMNLGIYPISDEQFIVIECTNVVFSCTAIPGGAYLVGLTDAESQDQAFLEDVILLTPNNTGLFAWSQKIPPFTLELPDFQGIEVYNLATGTTKPLTQNLAVTDYQYSLSNLDEQTMLLTVKPRSSSSSHDYYVVFDDAGDFHVELRLEDKLATGEYLCVLWATTGTNIRVAPDGNSERVGSVSLGDRLLAVDHRAGWWTLADGNYISDSLVVASAGCDNIPFDFSAALEVIEPILDESLCYIRTPYAANMRRQPTSDSDWVGTINEDSGFVRGVGYAFNEADQLRWWQLHTGEWVREDFVEVTPPCEGLPALP